MKRIILFAVLVFVVCFISCDGTVDKKLFENSKSELPNYIAFTATSGKVQIKLESLTLRSAPPEVYLQYSYDGLNWTDFITSTNDVEVDFDDSDKKTVYIQAKDNVVNNAFGIYEEGTNKFSTSGSGSVSLSGNIMALIDNTGKTEDLTNLNSSVFYALFFGCSQITDACSLSLPSKTLASNCYMSMFGSCTGLTTAPELPATELADSCYSHMFTGCSSLISAPALPASTMKEFCYCHMFSDCSSLKNAPVLNAKTLAPSCYQSMFGDNDDDNKGCEALEVPPVLPATVLSNNCYKSMFVGCTALTSAPTLSATALESSCYESMFYGCTSLKINNNTGTGTLFFTCPSTIPTNAVKDMFNSTGGTFTGDPISNGMYYWYN